MTVKRFSLIIFFVVLFVSGSAYSGEEPYWEQYKTHFISEDGRIIDYYQNSASHSEGQGYGMLLAVMHDDRALFDKIWQWTDNNLRVRQDGLLGWLWGKRTNGKWEIIDYNNATDGDILVAYALLEAGEKWEVKEYGDEALKIIKAIREEIAFNWQGKQLLLPAYYGFTQGDEFIVNPSYFILPAFRAFAKVDQKSFWDNVHKGSSAVLSEAEFSTLRLPADWIKLGQSGTSVYSERSENFGYEAIRVPLYISMEEKPKFPQGMREILNTYNAVGYIPLWVNLIDNSFSLKTAPAGFYAVFARAAVTMGEDALSEKLLEEAKHKLAEEKDDYYSFTLYLLATGTNN